MPFNRYLHERTDQGPRASILSLSRLNLRNPLNRTGRMTGSDVTG